MKSYRAIRKYEFRRTNQIAKNLIDIRPLTISWRLLVFPIFIYDYIRYVKRLSVLRKNLFFTKQLALGAAQNIYQGKERAWEFRQLEIKTKEILNREKKGFYTEKIRNKQLDEIELLVHHYIDLLGTNQKSYVAAIKAKYSSQGSYLSFLNKLQKSEEEVIQAAITTMRRGSKRERRQWFEKVKQTTKIFRMQEVEKIYSKS
ncbi:MAG: NF038143 family protein [Desulfobacterales bacterium]|jgi:hypothetical protein